MCDTRCGGRLRTGVQIWQGYRHEAETGRFVLQGSVDMYSITVAHDDAGGTLKIAGSPATIEVVPVRAAPCLLALLTSCRALSMGDWCTCFQDTQAYSAFGSCCRIRCIRFERIRVLNVLLLRSCCIHGICSLLVSVYVRFFANRAVLGAAAVAGSVRLRTTTRTNHAERI